MIQWYIRARATISFISRTPDSTEKNGVRAIFCRYVSVSAGSISAHQAFMPTTGIQDLGSGIWDRPRFWIWSSQAGTGFDVLDNL